MVLVSTPLSLVPPINFSGTIATPPPGSFGVLINTPMGYLLLTLRGIYKYPFGVLNTNPKLGGVSTNVCLVVPNPLIPYGIKY